MPPSSQQRKEVPEGWSETWTLGSNIEVVSKQEAERRITQARFQAIPVAKLESLADWHERRAKVKRLNADQESDPTARATLLGNADTHDVAAAVVRRVLEGKSLEDSQ